MSARLIERLRELKAEHPDSLLVFKTPMGYALYEDDARVASQRLGLALRCSQSILWVSFPEHHREAYLTKIARSSLAFVTCDLEGLRYERSQTVEG